MLKKVFFCFFKNLNRVFLRTLNNFVLFRDITFLQPNLNLRFIPKLVPNLDIEKVLDVVVLKSLFVIRDEEDLVFKSSPKRTLDFSILTTPLKRVVDLRFKDWVLRTLPEKEDSPFNSFFKIW